MSELLELFRTNWALSALVVALVAWTVRFLVNSRALSKALDRSVNDHLRNLERIQRRIRKWESVNMSHRRDDQPDASSYCFPFLYRPEEFLTYRALVADIVKHDLPFSTHAQQWVHRYRNLFVIDAILMNFGKLSEEACRSKEKTTSCSKELDAELRGEIDTIHRAIGSLITSRGEEIDAR